MPRVTAALTALRVQQLIAAGEPVKVSDGGCAGLTLRVTGKGRASWLLRFTSPDGRRVDMGLGVVATAGQAGNVTLAEARDLAVQHRRTLRGGTDPLQAKRDARAAAGIDATVGVSSSPSKPTFRKVAEDFIAGREAAWRNAKHGAQWTATLRTYAFPTIGAMPVDTITTEHVLTVLRPVWTKIPETGARLRQRIEAVLDAAKALGHRQGENPARLKGHLAHLLPRLSRASQVKHYPSLPWEQVPAFLAVLEGKGGMAAMILRFAILTGCRSGEARGMTWGELDLPGATWTVPAARMKAKALHRIPLAPPVLALLRSRALAAEARHGEAGIAREALVFPLQGRDLKRPMSDMALSMVVRGMCFDGLAEGAQPRWPDRDGRAVVPHGFRSSFKGWSLMQAWPDHLSELALAHTDRNKVRGAYAHDDLLEERRKMMAAWAGHCCGNAAAPALRVVS